MFLKASKLKIEDYVKRQFLVTMCMDIGQIATGCGIAWMCPSLPKLQNIDQTPLTRTITDTEASYIVACIYIGCFGAIFIAYLSNIFGRKLTSLICSLLLIMSNCLVNWPIDVYMIYVANVLRGYGMTATTVINLVYLGEIASPNIRGIVLASTGVFNGVGILLAYSIGPFVQYTTLGYVLIGIEIVHFLALILVPESPIFYVIKGKEEHARDSLRKLGRAQNMETEMTSIIDFVQKQSSKSNICDLVTIKSNRKALLITAMLFVIQNSNGSVVMLQYAMTIFEKANASISTNLTMIIVGCIIFMGTAVSPLFIEKYGRKFLLVISTSCCAVSLGALGMYFYLAHSISAVGWVPLASFVLSLFTFYIGLGIIPNTLAGEMFNPNVRSLGTSVVMTIGWVSGLIVITTYGYIATAYGNHVNFFCFSIINFVGLVFTLVFVPETKGKTLMEVEVMLGK